MYGGSPRLVNFGKPSAEDVVKLANKVDDLDNIVIAVKVGDIPLSINRAQFQNLLKGPTDVLGDVATVTNFVKDAFLLSEVEPSGVYTVDPAELESELNLGGDKVKIEIDDDGRVTSTSIVSEEN